MAEELQKELESLRLQVQEEVRRREETEQREREAKQRADEETRRRQEAEQQQQQTQQQLQETQQKYEQVGKTAKELLFPFLSDVHSQVYSGAWPPIASCPGLHSCDYSALNR